MAAQRRQQARTLTLIMWRSGLRVSEALPLEWRDLDIGSETPTLIVRWSKSKRAKTIPLHGELVSLFTDWPVAHGRRERIVDLTMRMALRHIGDAIRHLGLNLESPGTGKHLPGAHSLRHSAARHWLIVGNVPLNVVGSDYGMENVP